MNVLSKFESFMTSMVEGSFGRVFRSKLQPVELKRKLERHMEDHLLILGEGRRQAHNFYDVALNQKDYDGLSSWRALIPELQQYLIDVARERGYTLTTKPVVKLHVDAHMVVGNIHIDSSLVDSHHPAQNPNVAQALAGPDAPMHTVTIDVSEGFKQAMLEAQQARAGAPHRPGQPYPSQAPPSNFQQPYGAPSAGGIPYPPQAAPAGHLPQAVLRLRRRGGQTGAEQVYRLDREVIQIGRHVSNDIVVNDRRVSRHHAQVRFENGRFVIYDLGSLNGIGINRTTVRQHTLRDGDLVSVGSYDFIFHQRR
ncbi:MAG TPA: FhaA domain-containing protein [Ktedonobacterales bacterium]